MNNGQVNSVNLGLTVTVSKEQYDIDLIPQPPTENLQRYMNLELRSNLSERINTIVLCAS